MMLADQILQDRIEELETDLRRHQDIIQKLRQERDELFHLIDQMRERIEDSNLLIDDWIAVFDMEQRSDGVWVFDDHQTKLWQDYAALLDHHNDLVRKWNRLVPKYNAAVAPGALGRPLAASKSQVKDVLRLRKGGMSLRKIAQATALSLATVRTIVAKDRGADRTSKRRDELRRREFDRLRAADYRRRKKQRDGLGPRAAELGKRGDMLIKAAKGLE